MSNSYDDFDNVELSMREVYKMGYEGGTSQRILCPLSDSDIDYEIFLQVKARIGKELEIFNAGYRQALVAHNCHNCLNMWDLMNAFRNYLKGRKDEE